jgi:glycosyltransferase involved in cell wall biosynthesis
VVFAIIFFMTQEFLSILMPVYNESRTLRTAIARVLASPVNIPLELVCVDDGSTDGSRAILEQLSKSDPRIKIAFHEKNRGKGAAIQTAIARMSPQATLALFQDADLEYDPRDYPVLLTPILEGNADAVFGSRFATGSRAGSGGRKILLYWHTVANKFLTWLINVLNDVNLTDMETCYKALRADILRQIPLKSLRFGIEPEITTRLAQWNIRLYEVPVSYHGRSVAEGKKIRAKDAFAAVWAIFKFRFLDTRFTTHDGYYILQSIRRAKGFNKWMLSTFRSHVGQRVLEAGCGIGNFTELLLDRQRLVCVDYDPFYVEMIQRRYGHLENLRVGRFDLTNPDEYKTLQPENLDTIICLNVVEHIEPDQEVLRHYFNVLAPGGHAVILVPAHPSLYSVCDKILGHYRRYTRRELRAKMEQAGFQVLSVREFNRLGVYGWLLNKMLKKPELNPRQMWLYELLLPLAKFMDFLRLGPGLSVVGIGQKIAPPGPAPQDPPTAAVALSTRVTHRL